MKNLFFVPLVIAFLWVADAADAPPRATTIIKKVVITFRSGASTSTDFTSGTIENVDNDFSRGKWGDRPVQYSYQNREGTGRMAVDLREVVSVIIENPR